MDPKDRIFPDGFLWGVATAAHQVEGNNDNDWTDWENRGGAKDKSGRACDHWNLERFRRDVALAKSLNQNAYRLSLEWSRIMPREGQIDTAALDRYREMLRHLKDDGFTTMATLHHFTNPRWFAEQGGWESGPLPPFLRYVGEAVNALDDYVDLWGTLNEPTGMAFMGWIQGQWPPGRKRAFLPCLRVLYRLARTHDAMYGLISRRSDKPVGLVHSMTSFEPPSLRHADRLLASAVEYLMNQWFLRSTRGDYIGVNYYTRRRLRLLRYLPLEISEADPEGRATDFGWEIWPKGIYDVLLSLKRYRLPVYVTENGLADAGDIQRASYIRDHLRWLRRAVAAGVPVKGYFHWSLLDNFEWAEGYSKRFGLIETDFATQERRLRPSALVYAGIAGTNGATLDDD